MKKLIVLTAVFAMVFAGTALAADWNFYGSARMQLFSNSMSKESAGNSYAGNPLAGANGNSWTETSFDMQKNTRLGANVSAGDVKGRFEYGSAGAPTSSVAGVGTRILYGSWNFGSGEMLVGQTYVPTYYGMSNSVYLTDNGQAGIGGSPANRNPMIQFSFGGFKVAAVAPEAAVTAKGAYTNMKNVLPKLELAYGAAMGPVNFYVAGGYQSVDAVNGQNNSKSVTSYVLTGKVMYAAGPFTVGVAGTYGTNMDDYGYAMFTDNTVGWNGSDYKDTVGYGLSAIVGFTINDMMGVEAGYGYQVSTLESSVKSATYSDDTASHIYVQLPLTLADGVFIIPELGLLDSAKDFTDAKEGDVTYVGAKFQINF
jgi:hypothetical protein